MSDPTTTPTSVPALTTTVVSPAAVKQPIGIFSSGTVRVLLLIISLTILRATPDINHMLGKKSIDNHDIFLLFTELLTVSAGVCGVKFRIDDRSPVYTADWLPGPSAVDYKPTEVRTDAQSLDSKFPPEVEHLVNEGSSQ